MPEPHVLEREPSCRRVELLLTWRLVDRQVQYREDLLQFDDAAAQAEPLDADLHERVVDQFHQAGHRDDLSHRGALQRAGSVGAGHPESGEGGGEELGSVEVVVAANHGRRDLGCSGGEFRGFGGV
jgi:hypothetical protein